ncbi:MAG: tyrosine-type recombinase/integrase [Pseudomonadota bacterium]|nr:site-specific integrase [Hyphomonas sp. Mor2]
MVIKKMAFASVYASIEQANLDPDFCFPVCPERFPGMCSLLCPDGEASGGNPMLAKQTKKASRNQTPDKDRFEWDDKEPGLGVRFRTGRNPTWYLQTRIEGKTVRRSLGLLSDFSLADAREIAREARDELSGAAPAPVLVPEISKATVTDFSEQFLKDGAPNWKPATIKAHRYVISRFIVPAFGTRDLASLTAEEVAAWWSGLDASAGTRNRTLAVLSGIIRHGELLGLRSPGLNPCQGLRRRKSSFKAYRLTSEDYGRLGRAIRGVKTRWPVEAAIFRFLALTGCRKSEARFLQWSMIDGKRAALPDSKTGPRAIWLGSPALKLLAEQPTLSEYVFAKRGKPVSKNQLDKIWHRVREHAELSTLRLHDLRHGFASVAISSGEPLRTVSGLLGHSDLQTTAGYAQFAEEPVRAAAARVADHLGEALAAQKFQPAPLPKGIVADFLAQGLPMDAFAEINGISLSTLRQKLAQHFKDVRASRAISEGMEQ